MGLNPALTDAHQCKDREVLAHFKTKNGSEKVTLRGKARNTEKGNLSTSFELKLGEKK